MRFVAADGDPSAPWVPQHPIRITVVHIVIPSATDHNGIGPLASLLRASVSVAQTSVSAWVFCVRCKCGQLIPRCLREAMRKLASIVCSSFSESSPALTQLPAHAYAHVVESLPTSHPSLQYLLSVFCTASKEKDPGDTLGPMSSHIPSSWKAMQRSMFRLSISAAGLCTLASAARWW